MRDCLVTKLKGIVDNDNLLKIGEFAFEKTSSIRFFSTDPITGQPQQVNLRIMSGGTFPGGTKSYIYTGDYTPLILSEPSKVAIEYEGKNIYRFLIAGGSTFNFADAKYVKTLRIIELYNPSEQPGLLEGDLKDCAEHPWTTFVISNQNRVIGDIANIKLDSSISAGYGRIDFRNTSGGGDGIYGDIASIASPYLEALNLWGASTGITGTLEGLVAALRVDRPTGSINFNMTENVNVTFGGEHYTGDATHAADGTALVWTENTITWNGITVYA